MKKQQQNVCLKDIAIKKYGTVTRFSRVLRIKKSHASHILNGTQPLKQEHYINRLAVALDIPKQTIKDFYDSCKHKKPNRFVKIITRLIQKIKNKNKNLYP